MDLAGQTKVRTSLVPMPPPPQKACVCACRGQGGVVTAIMGRASVHIKSILAPPYSHIKQKLCEHYYYMTLYVCSGDSTLHAAGSC